MLNENARAWVEALRSGKYKQTTYALRRAGKKKDSFCCLGVACKLYSDSVGGKWNTPQQPELEEQISFTDDTKELKGYDLTSSIMRWLGLATPIGKHYNIHGRTCSLVELNDEANFTFAQIAKIIESEPKGLFDK